MTDSVDVVEAPDSEEAGTPPASQEESHEQEQASAPGEASDADVEQKSSEEEQESEKPGTTEAADKGQVDKLQVLLDSKYNGDKNKLADAIFEQWNSASRLHSELKEIKTFLAEQREKASQAQVQEPSYEDDADYKALQEDIAALDESVQHNEQARQGLIQQYNKLDSEINKLVGQHAASDDFNKREIERRVEALIDKKERLSEKWDLLKDKDKSTAREKKALSSQLKQLEKQINESRAAQRRQEEELAASREEFRLAFFAEIDAEAKQAGLGEGAPKALEHFKQSIHADAVLYLQSHKELPDDFVQQRAKVYLDVHSLAKKAGFKELSAQKTPLVQKPGSATQLKAKTPVLANGNSKPAAPRVKSQKEAREWIEQAAQRFAAKRG